MERRVLQAAEIRAIEPGGEGQPRRLTGYAAVFNSPTDFGRFQERVAPGAFRKSLAAGRDIRALWNHNADFPLARSTNQTLRLAEDERGLRFELDLPDTTMGRDATISIQRGDVSGVSFGFMVPAGGDEWSTIAGKKTRTLLEVDLEEISPVTFPAYEQAQVEVRSLDALAAEAERKLPDILPLDHFERRTRLAEID